MGQPFERFASRVGLEVKYGGGPPEIRETLAVLSAVGAFVDKGADLLDELMAEASRLREQLRRTAATDTTVVALADAMVMLDDLENGIMRVRAGVEHGLTLLERPWGLGVLQ